MALDKSSGLDEQILNKGNLQNQMTLLGKRRLKLGAVPVALTCILHKKHLLADPTAEEEAVLHTTCTVVVDATGRLISIYKPGGLILATTSTVQVFWVPIFSGFRQTIFLPCNPSFVLVRYFCNPCRLKYRRVLTILILLCQDCIALARIRLNEVEQILSEALETTDAIEELS